MNEIEMVTCDNCPAVSESGWGDQPTCLNCTPSDLICDEHQRTHDGVCPLGHPTNTWICGDCGETCARFRGMGDVICECGALYNAGGQRLRDDAPTFGVNGYWGPTPYDDDDY